MKISACWIVKNEAAVLGRSIESLIDIADEMIVVDTGSTDNTVAVAEGLGARVEHFEWIGDFSAARNYAMSLASGDIIIFLDADEWFAPRLGPADRDLLENMLAKNSPIQMLTIPIRHVDQQTGDLINSTVVARIYRNKETLRYSGRIHEYIRPPSSSVNRIVSDAFSINHSGYSKELVAGKQARNISMLETVSEESTEGSEERIRFLMYLIRENCGRGEYEKSAGYLAEALLYPEVMRSVCRQHSEAFLSTLYAAVVVAFKRRSRFSRKDLRRKLFDLFKKVYPNYPGTQEIDILYQALFDMREGRYLSEFAPAVDAVSRMPASSSPYYKDHEQPLYERAAIAAWRRGDREKCQEYAAAALKIGENNRPQRMLHILLSAMKGQEAADVIFFLNGIFNISRTGDLDFLVNGTALDGFGVVHSYYLKKRIDCGYAYVHNPMKLLLIYGEYDGLAALAEQAHSAGDADAERILFLAGICGASPELIDPYTEMFKEYAHILRAYRNQERLTPLTAADMRILGETYSTVAFVAGMETADRYLDVFRAKPDLCFTTKAGYCEISGLPEHLLNEDMSGIDRLNFPCRRYRIQALISTGRYDDALQEIEDFLKVEFTQPELLNMLQVTAEKEHGETGAKARKLYEQHAEMYDILVDLADVLTTGIVIDEGGKKQNQFFKAMTRTQFDGFLAEEAARPAIKRLLDLYRKAADVYRQKGFPAEAARCLWRLIAHGCAEEAVCESLAEIFAELKNSALPDYIRTLKA